MGVCNLGRLAVRYSVDLMVVSFTIDQLTSRILIQMLVGEDHAINVTCDATRTVLIFAILMQTT